MTLSRIAKRMYLSRILERRDLMTFLHKVRPVKAKPVLATTATMHQTVQKPFNA